MKNSVLTNVGCCTLIIKSIPEWWDKGKARQCSEELFRSERAYSFVKLNNETSPFILLPIQSCPHLILTCTADVLVLWTHSLCLSGTSSKYVPWVQNFLTMEYLAFIKCRLWLSFPRNHKQCAKIECHDMYLSSAGWQNVSENHYNGRFHRIVKRNGDDSHFETVHHEGWTIW